MVTRTPLVLVDGRPSLLPAGDNITMTDAAKGDVRVSNGGDTWTLEPQVKFGIPVAMGQKVFFN